MVLSTLHLRSEILHYAEKKLPQCFTEFKLYEEQQDNTTSLALYRYIMSQSFSQTNDPIFIALCQRYIRWGQLVILFFVAAIIDIDFINHMI